MTERTPHADVATRFGRAAGGYDDAASVQREICRRLSALAAEHAPVEGPLLDAGCGTGFGLDHLTACHPGRLWVGVDIAPAMLARVQGRHPALPCVAGDIEALPVGDARLGGIWSSLCLQWCDPAVALSEFARVLRPGGVVWLATLGPGTFTELRHAFDGIDGARHVLDCPSPAALHAAAGQARLEVLGEEHQLLNARAPDLAGLLRDIKAAGAQGVGSGRRQGLLGRRAWRTIENRYEAYRQPDGLVTISYDALLLVLRKPT